jgi:type VI secretion system protein ImpA
VDFPFDKLADDVSADRPSGPDLEIEGDAEFMRFSAQIDGVLPESFASFDRAAADLPAHLETIAGLVMRSRDLRLMTAAAKLLILDRDFAGFEKALGVIAHWLRTRWDTLLPELTDGDAMFRSIALQSLDDVPHTVKPLEAAPLFKSRRLGVISLRSVLLADGKIAPRQGDGDGADGEKVPNPSDIAAAIRETDIDELVKVRAQANAMAAALADIEALWSEKTGEVGALQFNELRPKVGEICAFLESSVASRDPSLADPAAAQASDDAAHAGGEARAPAVAGAIATSAAARAALEAAQRYFEIGEPSSPVRLVLAQAAAILGKDFYQSLQQLVPDVASQATVSFGRDLPLKLPLERLALLLPQEAAAEEDAPDADGWGEAQAETESEGEDGAAPDESADESSWSEDAAPAPRERPSTAGFAAADRAQALALLDQVSAFFRAEEPSSAVPLLIDIARSTVGRDFMTLLRDALPPQTLRVDE